MRHVPPEHGHPLRQIDPPVRPAWATPDRPTNLAAVQRITQPVLRDRLEAKGLGPTVVDGLVRERSTAGAAWRITQELDL